jgi:tRNA A37 threonylcarbamoyladenosine dehydratase
MRMHPFHRTELLLGGEGQTRVAEASVCVIGLGGVGSYAAEALARSGVGHLTLVDFDRVCLTNMNRQLHATRSTVGQSKAELMGARVLDIHPRCDCRVLQQFYNADSSDEILDRRYDAVLDCVDNMSAKLHLLETCVRRGIPVFSAMGAGGRMDPTRVRVSDLAETRNDPFAKIVRKELRARGVEGPITAVWSDEPPNDLDAEAQAAFRCICPDRADSPHSCDRRMQVQGSVAWMPPMFGLAMAGAVVHHLVGRTIAPLPELEPRVPRVAPAPNKLSAARRKELTLQAALDALAPVSAAQVADLGAAPGGDDVHSGAGR